MTEDQFILAVMEGTTQIHRTIGGMLQLLDSAPESVRDEMKRQLGLVADLTTYLEYYLEVIS